MSMENPLEDWSKLWQSRQAPDGVDHLIAQLKKVEQAGKKERRIFIITVPLTLIFLAAVLPWLQSAYYLWAIALIATGMLLLVFQLYRSRMDPVNDKSLYQNPLSVDAPLKALRRRMYTTNVYMWVYSFFILAGVNVGYLQVLNSLGTGTRILIHFVMTALLLVGMYLGIKKRQVKNSGELEPLIQQLEALRAQLQKNE